MNNILGENDNNLELFFNISVDLMAIVGNDDKFKKVSNGWYEVLGWTQEELLKLSWKDIVHKDDLDNIIEIISKEKKFKKNVRVENRFISKNDECKWLEWSYKYIQEKEVFFVTARDITDRKEREHERIEYERAMELEKIKSQFFSNISHEFKTPLNIILATMQLINSNIKNDKIIANSDISLEKYVGSIRQNCYRLLRLVNNVIDISKMDYGYYDINLGNYNIVSIVEDITMSVLEYVNNKGINLVFDTEIEEKIIACDPDKIERIVLNLLSNAIKYTKDSGTISVNVWEESDGVYICIRDNGIGIPSEMIDNIFSRYVQIDNKLTRSYNGSGIGLSLVKSLVEMHEGDVFVESKVDEGTKFIIRLPIKQIEETEVKRSDSNLASSRVEKCNIEFADIYK